MATKTKIEWADYVSNPLKANFLDGEKVRRGYACVKHSEGCANCWASTFNVRLGTGLAYTLPNLAKVDLFWDEAEEKRLETFKVKGPFKNGRTRPILFINDMTDLFGGWVDVEHQKRTFGVMEWRRDIDFVILTKRPENMLAFVAGSHVLPNVILGTSIENQKRADERLVPMLNLAGRGWRTMVSYEPALGPVNWQAWAVLDWLICGGESGHGARPMHPDWARQARDFCHTYEIPFFFKQWGEWMPVAQQYGDDDLVFELDRYSQYREMCLGNDGTVFSESGQRGEEFWCGYQPTPNTNPWFMARVGRGKSGHQLDGQEWREVPNG
jgi:protein gp37